MSDFFIQDRNAAQSIINTEFNPAPAPTPQGGNVILNALRNLSPSAVVVDAATDTFDINWNEVGRASGRSLAQLGGGIADLGTNILNIPNNALETPDYLVRGNEYQQRAFRRVADPNFDERTQAAQQAEQLRDYLRSTWREGALFARDTAPQSEATQLLSGLAEVMTPALIAGPLGAGGPGAALAFSTEERTYVDMIDRGVREEVARGAALQDAGFMAAMGVAPVAFGGTGRTLQTRLLQRGLSGAGINLAFGAAMRGNMNAYLTEQGYPELAREYQFLDTRAMLIDGIMGFVFGGLFGHALPPSAEPHATPMTSRAAEQAPQQLPQDADGYFEEARQYGNDQQLPEAYAFALVAREMGHPEADGLVTLIEEEASAADMEQGRAIATDIIESNLGVGLRDNGFGSAALIEAGRINEETSFGVPETPAAQRWQSEALSRMEGQAARDEAIDPGPVPDDVGFVPLPETGAPEWDAAMRAFEEEALAARLDETAAEIRRLREERGDVLGPPEDSALFSMGVRGVDPQRGNERFYDERLSPSQNKAVEMARNNYSNAEIAEEMDVSVNTARVLLSQAKRRAPDIQFDAARTGLPRGTNPRTGERTATIQEIVSLYNRLSRAGYRNRPGNPVAGRRNLNTVIGERLGLDPKNVAKRLFDYRADLAAGRIEGEPLYSYGDGEGFSTVAELEARAERELGAAWDVLSTAARLEIVADVAELRARADELGLRGEIDARTGGVHIRKLKRTFIVAENVAPRDLYGVILHEIGVHHGMEEMLGKNGFKEVLRQIERMVREQHPAIMEARAAAIEGSMTAKYVPEETLAYLIEYRADLPLVNRLLSRIRQWLIRTFGSTFGMRLTIDDLRGLALTSFERVVTQAGREVRDATFASPQDLSRSASRFRDMVQEEALFSTDAPDAGVWDAETFYHGSARPIEQFDGPIHLTPDENIASLYSNPEFRDVNGGSVIPLQIRRGRTLVINEPLPAGSQRALIERARREGYDTIEMRSVRDDIDVDGNVAPQRQIIVLDARNNVRRAGSSGGGQNWVDVNHGTYANIEGGFAPGSHFGTERAARRILRDVAEDTARGIDTSGGGRIMQAQVRGPFVRAADMDTRWDSPRAWLDMAEDGARGEIPARGSIAGAAVNDAERAFWRSVRDDPQIQALSERRRGPDTQRALNERLSQILDQHGFSNFSYRNAYEGGTSYYAPNPANVRGSNTPDGGASGGGSSSTLPNAGSGGDFPLFSQRGQNRENLLGAKRDPIESPTYQRRIAELRSRIGGKDAEEGAARQSGQESRSVDGVRGDANAGGRPIGTDAQSLKDVLAVSGIRLFTRPRKGKGEILGAYRLSVDTPIASDADGVLLASDTLTTGNFTRIDFDFIDGSNPKETRLPGVHVAYSRAHSDAAGLRVGEWMYRQLIEWADRRGLPVYSDGPFGVSTYAQRTYARLEDMGYVVERVSRRVEKDPDDGALVSKDGLPVFRVSLRDPIETELIGADAPPGDYQIDGPTLRERQQRIDEQMAREDAYNKLPPAEQAIADDPEMILSDIAMPMFSRGGPRKRRYTARLAMEDARLEAERAAEMRKGFEAAARCAARHGAGQASRASVITAGVIAESTPASMLGQTLGLALSVPVGVTVAPFIGQSANPRRYTEGRLRAAAESLADAEARRGRNAAQAGRNAGLDAPTTYNDLEGEPLWDNVATSSRADNAPVQDSAIPMQSVDSGAGANHQRERAGVSAGLDPAAWDDQTPTTFAAPGATVLGPGLKVPPAPPNGPKPQPARDADVLAELFGMIEDEE